jgi:thiol:disulfide interchange protein DsbD
MFPFSWPAPAHRRPLAWLVLLLLAFTTLTGSNATAQGTTAPADIEFTPIEAAPPGPPATDTSAQPAAVTKRAPATLATPTAPRPASVSLWVTLLTGLLGGFAAVLMPCIFPLLPMTVSFFTKRASSRSAGIRQALLYGGSIVVIYVALGLLITVVFGADALNNLATNGLFNLFFFGLLVVFAASFLGAFELTLPSAWVNKTDSQADKGGALGIFFMAATLALVSFSCTGPIIGTLLVQAASTGQLLGPAVGMLGFSVALALPFTLLSLFPGWLASLPKSGGWLNAVKVVLGFLELALALKFLSNVDLAYHWEWFDREVFLALWIIIFALLGFYLLGKLSFSHDGDTSFISLPRLFLAIITLAFTVYLVPGLWGAPLQAVAAFLPPQTTQDFDLYTPTLTGRGASAGSAPRTVHRYADLFHAPLGLDAYFDYAEARAAAQAAGKPLLIDFTGHACVNCRKMEATVWPDKQVLPLIRDQYILVQLYVDDKTDLPATEQFVSTYSGKKITTLAGKWSDLQASRYNANSQPYYVLLDPADERILTTPQGANYDPANFQAFLASGLQAYKAEK